MVGSAVGAANASCTAPRACTSMPLCTTGSSICGITPGCWMGEGAGGCAGSGIDSNMATPLVVSRSVSKRKAVDSERPDLGVALTSMTSPLAIAREQFSITAEEKYVRIGGDVKGNGGGGRMCPACRGWGPTVGFVSCHRPTDQPT